MQNRDAIFSALQVALEDALVPALCKTVTADIKTISEESEANTPALYIIVMNEPVLQESDDPTVERISIMLEVHCDKGNLLDKDSVPTITPILNGIDAVVGPQAKNAVTGKDQNLGGLVRYCRRSGPTRYILDPLGVVCGAVVPLEALVNH